MKKNIIFILLVIFLSACTNQAPETFNGQKALEFAQTQMDFGPRTPGSPGHAAFVQWATQKFSEHEWEVEVQNLVYDGKDIKNIIAKRAMPNAKEWIILGAHYDTRFFADQDENPANQLLPVPGANDGASGVAVLLELARVLPEEVDKNIWLVLFDAEDQGYIDDWDWILGSSAFAEQLDQYPDKVVIVDMIGDRDLNIFFEGNSDPQIQAEIWSIAENLGYGEFFIPEVRYHILDDHTPFLKLGIPSIDMIDFDYPYWHTLEDTTDKISSESLEAVGDTLYHWLLVP